MSIRNRQIFQLIAVAGVAFVLGLSVPVAFAADNGMRVLTPNEIYVHNRYGQADSYMVADFDSTELTVMTGSFHVGKTFISMSESCYRELGSNTGWHLAWTYVDNCYIPCYGRNYSNNGVCSGDNKVWFGSILINHCAPEWDGVDGMLQGDYLERYVLTHEMGHLVGLDHYFNCETDSVMVEKGSCCPLYPASGSFIYDLKTLDKSDINGLYP